MQDLTEVKRHAFSFYLSLAQASFIPLLCQLDTKLRHVFSFRSFQRFIFNLVSFSYNSFSLFFPCFPHKQNIFFLDARLVSFFVFTLILSEIKFTQQANQFIESSFARIRGKGLPVELCFLLEEVQHIQIHNDEKTRDYERDTRRVSVFVK